MYTLRLIALAFLLTGIFLSSCDRDDDTLQTPDTSRYVSNYDFFLTGAQVRPVPNSTSASGSIEGTYDKRTKTYTFKLTWAGLSGPVTAIHIHGIADRGFLALPAPLGPHANGIAYTTFGHSTATSGTFSGSLFIDGVVIKEENFLAGKYYVDIHTAAHPAGQLRGQIIFP